MLLFVRPNFQNKEQKMLVKDKDILVGDAAQKDSEEKKELQTKRAGIKRENMRKAWGDAFDYYIRGITEKYLLFRGRATRLEFWGFSLVSGLFLLILFFLGNYAGLSMLPYYFLLATFLPAMAVAARRLHDVNKNAALYLGAGLIPLISFFFIGLWGAALLALVWGIILVRLFSQETYAGEGFYGMPNHNDEIYAEDNLPIIKKFRFLALVLFIVEITFSCIRFADWSVQSQQKATIDDIMMKVIEEGQSAQLSEKQIQEAQKKMMSALKAVNGQTVSPEYITEQINKAVQSTLSGQ